MYKCTKCGSTEVEALTWMDLNTGEEQDGEVGEYYCRSCQAQTDVTFERGVFDDDEPTTNEE